MLGMITCATLIASSAAIAQTVFTGAVNNDINNAGNWDNGLPTNDGSNDGTVPDGFPALTGSPQNKTITFEGNSGFTGNNFGGNQANGYNVTFNGSGNADFTGNGLFLAWDGGANNDSSFTWNSTGTANTTRWFTSRFGMGAFTQSAGTINQNATGNFEMIVGEFGAPQDPLGGTTNVMTGGTLNSMAGEFEPRFGTMDMSGGTINCNNMKWDEGRGGSTFVWNFSGGEINATDLSGFNNGDRFNFTADSTGVLNVLNSNYSIADAENDINSGWITIDGAPATPPDFLISVVDIGGSDFTEIRTGSQEFRITSFFFVGTEVTLTWDSQENVPYSVRYSTDMIDWGADFEDAILGDPGAQTTRSYDLVDFGLQDEQELYIRVERN